MTLATSAVMGLVVCQLFLGSANVLAGAGKSQVRGTGTNHLVTSSRTIAPATEPLVPKQHIVPLSKREPLALRKIEFSGITIEVPVGWPVEDLEIRRGVCPQLTAHVIYLGTASDDASCPARLVGVSDTLQLIPLNPGRARLARSGNSTLPVENQAAHEITAMLPHSNVEAVLTFGSSDRIPLGLLAKWGMTRARTQSFAEPAGLKSRGEYSPPTLSPSTYIGLGFDTCGAPSFRTLRAWRASPFRSVGIYIGGAERGCAQPNLTPSLLVRAHRLGWNFVPTYVGLQAPCTDFQGRIDPGRAPQEGVAAAEDAIIDAQRLGLGVGNPIYFDMEGYQGNESCIRPVTRFLSAWTRTLHLHGYISGLYGSATTTIRNMAEAPRTPWLRMPDDAWIADWNGRANSSASGIPASAWDYHRRLHQYAGPHDSTYGGITIDIDTNFNNGVVAPSLPNHTFLLRARGVIYRLVDGVPLRIFSCLTIPGGCHPRVAVSTLANLKGRIGDGQVLIERDAKPEKVFKAAGGSLLPIPQCVVRGVNLCIGPRTFVNYDSIVVYDTSHRRPLRGALLRSEPSAQTWISTGRARTLAGPSTKAVSVDDASLGSLPLEASPRGDFADNFATAARWKLHRGKWRVAERHLYVKTRWGSVAFATAKRILFGDGTYQFNLSFGKALGQDSWAGISVGKDIPSEGYTLTGYTLMVRRSGAVGLWKPGVGLIARGSTPSPLLHSTMRVRLVRQAGKISVYIGARTLPVLSTVDVTATAYGSGYLSLIDRSGGAVFSEVRVSH